VRAIFLGTPPSAVPTLDALVQAGHAVARVVTRPDRPVGRSGAARAPAVKVAAERLGIEVEQPENIRTPDFAHSLRATDPDVLVVVAYGRILPRAVLDAARIAPLNVHFSLLPRYRGAAPVQWALVAGETSTGVTTMRMSEGLDEGDVLLQETVRIEPQEHAPALLERLSGVGARLLIRTLDGLARGTLTPRPQDPSRASYAPILKRQDGVADFARAAREIEGRVRGFDPWPGVWARRRGRRVRIVEAHAVPGALVTEPSGRVLALEDGTLGIACGGGTVLAVRAIRPEGRRVLSARDAVNGRQLLPGDDLDGGR